MVVSARARTLDGPWENSPYNPVVRATSRADPGSKGGGSVPSDGGDDGGSGTLPAPG